MFGVLTVNITLCLSHYVLNFNHSHASKLLEDFYSLGKRLRPAEDSIQGGDGTGYARKGADDRFAEAVLRKNMMLCESPRTV